jgi:hypothetical protein
MPDEELKDRSRRSIERLVINSNLAEVILNIFKAGLSTAPFCGGIASLMTDYIPSARALRLEQFAAQTASDLSRLADTVHVEYIKTDDFAFMFEKCFRGVAENPQREKIAAFGGILVNSVLREDYSGEEKEYFVNLINNLSAPHVRLLRFLHDPDKYLEVAGIPRDRIQGGFAQFIPTRSRALSWALFTQPLATCTVSD